jgi:transcriptional regulator with XRE-family HTH domain
MGIMNAKRGTARIRSLATELTDLRAQAGLNTRDAAKLVGMSPSTLNRLENGGKSIQPEDVSALLVAYRVTGLNLARESNFPGWWDNGGGALPKHLPALISFESDANRIIHVSLLLVPGLLQTADYIRAFLASTGVTGSEMETRVATRLGRHAVLSKPQAPAYLAIIDEAALRRPIGGPEVMAAQLRHLIAVSRRRNVDIRIIPFAAGPHAGLDGTYVVLEFVGARTIVYLEHKRSSVFIDEPEDVAPFNEATDKLIGSALGPADSFEFLASVADDYGKG